MKRWFAAAALSVVLVAAVACGDDDDSVPTTAPAPTAAPTAVPTTAPPAGGAAASTGLLGPGDTPAPPTGALDTSKDYTAVIELAKGGEIEIKLFDDLAPLTVENFINLSRIGYYDGVTFHRVIKDFMAQTGDPTGTGTGGPGYRFQNEFSPELRHNKPGIVSMANAGFRLVNGRLEATNGSQFFITFVPIGIGVLDGYDADGNPKNCTTPGVSCHSVFGEVTRGMDVLNSVRLRDPATDPNPGDAIKTIRIIES